MFAFGTHSSVFTRNFVLKVWYMVRSMLYYAFESIPLILFSIELHG